MGERSAEYRFSRVYGPSTGNREFYDAVAAPMVRALVGRGESGVLMAYGITGAGKTHSMMGMKDAPGLVPSALTQVFESLPCGCSVLLSLYEVYNERIGDLLAPGAAGPSTTRPGSARLRLCERADGRVAPRGVTELRFSTEREAQAAVRRAMAARAAGRTALNKDSSRSHAVFTITVLSGDDDGTDGAQQAAQAVRRPRLALVDLAGSERAHRTGASGARLQESATINASLMTLGRCFEALRYNQARPRAERRLVPYRESKVTHLFRDAFHGRGALALLVCVSPAPGDYDETQHVLRYAAVAAKVRTTAEVDAAPKARTLLDEAIEEGDEAEDTEDDAEDPMETAPTPVTKRKRGEMFESDPLDDDEEDEDEGDDGADFVGDLGRAGGDVDVMGMRAEMEALRTRLAEAEAAAARIETDVREEVSAEMAELIKAMEENYQHAGGARGRPSRGGGRGSRGGARKGRSTNAFERRLRGLNEADEEEQEEEEEEEVGVDAEAAEEGEAGHDVVEQSDDEAGEEDEGVDDEGAASTRKRPTARSGRGGSQAPARIETDVREEVSAEMAELIKAMEENYQHAGGARGRPSRGGGRGSRGGARKGRSTNAFERRLRGLNEADEEEQEEEEEEEVGVDAEAAEEGEAGHDVVEQSDDEAGEEDEGVDDEGAASTRKRPTARSGRGGSQAAAALAEAMRARVAGTEEENARLRAEKALAERRAAEHKAAAEAAVAEAAKMTDAVAEARAAMERTLAEERTQLAANAAMEREVLEEQLRRQKSELDAALARLTDATGRANAAAEGRRQSMAVLRAVIEQSSAAEAEAEAASMEQDAAAPAGESEDAVVLESPEQATEEAEMESEAKPTEAKPTKAKPISPEVIDLTGPTPAPALKAKRGRGRPRKQSRAAGKENAAVTAAKEAALMAAECAAAAMAAITPRGKVAGARRPVKRQRRGAAAAAAGFGSPVARRTRGGAARATGAIAAVDSEA